MLEFINVRRKGNIFEGNKYNNYEHRVNSNKTQVFYTLL